MQRPSPGPSIPEEKRPDYRLFLAIMRAGVIHVAFALIALVSFAFGQALPIVLGFMTLLAGTLVVVIDFLRRSHFMLSLTVLGFAMLVTAVNLS